MEEELSLIMEMLKEAMDASVIHLENELSKIRAGKASPSLLDSITVDYYNSMIPLHQIANINTLDAKTIVVQPWEKNMLSVIEKAIMAANIGLTPQNNGERIIINVPSLTEERRKILVKKVKNEGELTKVSVRNARKDANASIKNLVKGGVSEDLGKKAEDNVQEMINDYYKKIEKLIEAKEIDIMTV